jgi:hypothetical protein
MLRPEYGPKLNCWLLDETIDDVPEGMVDRRVITDDTYACPP